VSIIPWRKHQHEYAAAGSSQGGADPNFTHSLRDTAGQNTIDTDRGKQQRYDPKRFKQRERKTPLSLG